MIFGIIFGIMPSFLTIAPIAYFCNELVAAIALCMTCYASTLLIPSLQLVGSIRVQLRVVTWANIAIAEPVATNIPPKQSGFSIKPTLI